MEGLVGLVRVAGIDLTSCCSSRQHVMDYWTTPTP